MADKIPVKAKYTGSDTTGLAEFESGDTLSNSYLNTGTGANQLVQLDGSAKLPAVDGSQLTGIDGLPTQTSHSGKYLTTNGSAASWGTVASGGVNITSNATAPSSPSVGDQWYDTANGVLYVRVTDGTDAAWLDISSANGTAAAAAGGGGGAWEVISSQAVTSAVSSVDFTSLSGYSTYKIVMTNLKGVSHGSYLRVNISQGGSFQTGSWDAGREYLTDTASSRSFSGASQIRTGQLVYSGDPYPASAVYEIHNADIAGATKTASCRTMGLYGNVAIDDYCIGRYTAGSSADYRRVIDGLQITSDWSNNVLQGVFTLYGLKIS
jgi:hypothetical protein